MPVVFVHGVANRKNAAYTEDESTRDAFLKRYLGAAMGVPPEQLDVANPYWGGEGAKFAWNQVSLPSPSKNYQAFGNQQRAAAYRAYEQFGVADVAALDLVKTAKDFGLPTVVDFIWGQAGLTPQDKDGAERIATSFAEAYAYAQASPKPNWLDQPGLSNENFIDVLKSAVSADLQARGKPDEKQNWESFGGSLWDNIKESVSRLVSAPGAAVSAAGISLFREALNGKLSIFVGDALAYVNRRGPINDPGPIVKEVCKHFQEADALRNAKGGPLIVIGHSFGGMISYDIFTSYMKALKVDLFVSVGSQVALFEEMKLYHASNRNLPTPQTPKMAKPENVARWLNVFDSNDVLSYVCEGVFDGVKDFLFETGSSAVSAHSDYFVRPSFYFRLGERLKKP
jgi:hypothetical protein